MKNIENKKIPKIFLRESKNYVILNLTNHRATPKQKKAGVIELKPYDDTIIKGCLTFDDIPTYKEMMRRIMLILEILEEYNCQMAMIGGASFFMPILERVLLRSDILPVYAFSKRNSREVAQQDGSVKKQVIFDHLGFYSPFHQGPLPEAE